jgi:hypothetical protein
LQPWNTNNFYWREPVLTNQEKIGKREYQRKWSKHAREKNKNYFKNLDLKRTYGVTIEWYKSQHNAQNGLCAICNKPETAQIRGKVLSLAVDHCHGTGAVRELLCRACNNAIGAMNHDPITLRKAANYLEKHTSVFLKKNA